MCQALSADGLMESWHGEVADVVKLASQFDPARAYYQAEPSHPLEPSSSAFLDSLHDNVG